MAETQPQGCTPQLRLMRALAAAGCWSGVRADGCSSANSRVLQGCELCETGRRGEPIWFAFEINPKCFCFLKNTVLLNRCGMILNQGWGKKKQNNTSGFLKPTELLLALGSGHHSVRPPDPGCSSGRCALYLPFPWMLCTVPWGCCKRRRTSSQAACPLQSTKTLKSTKSPRFLST